MAEPRFIHLRVCSDFSLSHGLAKVDDLVKQVANLQMPAMALTDFTNLFGLVKFYDSAHAAGIKPIVGAEFLMQSEMLGEQLCCLTILAANNHGYHNLTRLISRAYLRGHIQGVPVIDRQWLVTYKTGLILLSGGEQGDIGILLLRDRPTQISQCITFYQQHFPNHYYLEISRTGKADEGHYIQAVLPLAASSGLPVVATHPVCFINPEDYEAHEIRVAIHHGCTLNDPQRPTKYNAQHYLRSANEMCEQFADVPEALINSVEIAKRCNVTLHLGDHFMPQFPTGDMTTEAYLIQQAEAGLSKRLAQQFPDESERIQQQPRYRKRLARELAVINQMGFPGYFLIVMEFIQWSKQQGIPVGPGRGSGPGSLVAYALQITDIDPLAFDLLFERFLNPERVSLPDFDIDFCMDQRDRVIEHVAERYGRESVSQIITFGTMTAKAVIRDVGRVLGHPYGFVDRIAKLIPQELGITLEKALTLEPQLALLCEQDEEVQALIDKSRKLEGVVRNAGKHAGGVVIAPTRITDFAPLYCDPQGQHPVTQFDKSDVEYIGLVKFDFLGLRTLTIIHAALEGINARLSNVESPSSEPPLIDINTISLADADSFALLKSGQTTAIFQLESRGMKELIRRLQPDSFEEIIALVALFRPGPLQSGMVDNFIDRKQGRETVAYPDRHHQHPLLRPILEPTYGIILYQEQVMQIAQVLAGYTLGEADLLRRAMGKKDSEEMAEQRTVFEQGAKNNGIDGTLAVKIFDLMEKFAGYGFNKSHSAAYALLSYQTLWLKSHFPADFMAAVMSADLDNTDKIVSLVEECRRMELTVLPPDINRSLYGFSVTSAGEIIYGLGAIKGVGSSAVAAIVTARGSGRTFANLYDLCARTDSQRLNRRSLEKLIMAGALDSLLAHRAALMATLENALKYAEQRAKAEQQGQTDMFGLLAASSVVSIPRDLDPATVPKWSEQQRLSSERQTLGLYLTGHPIIQYLPELKHYTQCRLRALKPTARDQLIRTAGLVVTVRVVSSKRGTQMGLLTLDDCSARLEALLYSETLARYRSLLERERLLVVTGSVSVDNVTDGLKMVVHEVAALQEMRAKKLRSLALQLSDQQMDTQFCSRLRQILAPHCVKEGAKIEVHYQQEKGQVNLCLGQAWQVNPTDSLLAALQGLVGLEQVVLQFD